MIQQYNIFIQIPQYNTKRFNPFVNNNKTTQELRIIGGGRKTNKNVNVKSPNLSYINLYILASNTEFGFDTVNSVINKSDLTEKDLYNNIYNRLSLRTYLLQHQKRDTLTTLKTLPPISPRPKNSFINPRYVQSYNYLSQPSIVKI